jgi:hypothetical protein
MPLLDQSAEQPARGARDHGNSHEGEGRHQALGPSLLRVEHGDAPKSWRSSFIGRVRCTHIDAQLRFFTVYPSHAWSMNTGRASGQRPWSESVAPAPEVALWSRGFVRRGLCQEEDASTVTSLPHRAADLSVPERVLLFGVASKTDCDRASIRRAAITSMIFRGLIQRNPIGQLSLTKQGRATFQALIGG